MIKNNNVKEISDMYKGLGIHHVGIGVKKLDEMKLFYRDILGFNNTLIEFGDSPQEMMQAVVRTKPVAFAMVMFNQDPDGVLIELVQMSNPVPRAIRKDFRYGDIGVSKITMVVQDVNNIYEELKDKIKFCSKPKSAVIPGWRDYRFVYCKDPGGNLIEFISGANSQIKNKFCDFRCVGISVTNLARSIDFYQNYLGFDKVVIQTHDRFSGLVDEISGSTKTEVKSCVLANSRGGGMVELFEVTRPRGRSIPFGTIWGDFGYLQTCLYCENIAEITHSYIREVIEPLSDFVVNEDASFIYMKDPDGIPVELLLLHNGSPENKTE
jgi:catechol 2,3-dioxygenase-like lactoylglutathione lyase family enzyme